MLLSATALRMTKFMYNKTRWEFFKTWPEKNEA